MKKLMLLAATAIAMAGCWKETEDVNTFETLTGTRWIIGSHVAYGGITPGEKCDIADSLVFLTDSTGYYKYPKPCDSGDATTITFKWQLSYDRLNLYYRDIGGIPRQNVVVGVSEYRHKELRLREGKLGKRFLDGYFVEVSDSM